jgi:hypothetical protein
MIRRFLAALVLAAIVMLSPPQLVDARTHAPAGQSQLAQFQTEAAAQAHCPRDVVVWLNIPSGIYHEKGMRWYGRTKHGAYVCRKEADVAGDRDTRNGQ